MVMPEAWKEVLEESLEDLADRLDKPIEDKKEGRHAKYQYEQLQKIYERDFNKRYQTR